MNYRANVKENLSDHHTVSMVIDIHLVEIDYVNKMVWPTRGVGIMDCAKLYLCEKLSFHRLFDTSKI